MAKKKKNQHIMYHRNWHPASYSAHARYDIWARLRSWENYTDMYNMNFSEVIADACKSYKCNMIKHRIIKGLRRYGKRKGLI